MISDAALDAMRATSAAALPDAGTFTRPAPLNDGTLDAVTDEWTPATGTVIYSGPLRVRPVTSADQSVIFGDVGDVTRQRYVVTLPADAPEIHIGDELAMIMTSDPCPASFRVVAVAAGSWLIDRRIGVERITSSIGGAT